MFHIYKSILILHFLLTIIKAIQWVRVGHKHDDDLPKTEIYHTSDQSYCTINSYYDMTQPPTNMEMLVWPMEWCVTMFLKKVHCLKTSQNLLLFDDFQTSWKGICCGGYFGTTDGNDRLLHSNRCAYLTSDGWVPIENIPDRMRLSSSLPIKSNGVDVGWLVSGGFSKHIKLVQSWCVYFFRFQTFTRKVHQVCTY